MIDKKSGIIVIVLIVPESNANYKRSPFQIVGSVTTQVATAFFYASCYTALGRALCLKYCIFSMTSTPVVSE